MPETFSPGSQPGSTRSDLPLDTRPSTLRVRRTWQTDNPYYSPPVCPCVTCGERFIVQFGTADQRTCICEDCNRRER